jgi:GntR family transcriptional regulator, transcriptional repressor for pyruvate dehydrogenase complex
MTASARKLSSLALRIEERAPLSVLVSRQLREAIVSGRMSVGTEFPSEKELTQELGVGRSTIREALRILQAQGLLSGGDTVSTQRPRVSATHTLTSAAQAMENVVRLGQMPIRDLVELRLVIEGAALEEAAQKKGDGTARDDLAQARAALSTMREPGIDIPTFRDADLRFHRNLVGAAGNAAFPLVMGVLREAIAAHLGEALLEVKDVKRTMAALRREHEAIFAAVESGRGKQARELVTRHIRSFYISRKSPREGAPR